MVGEELLKEIFLQDWADVHCLRGSPLCLLVIFLFPSPPKRKVLLLTTLLLLTREG